MSFSGGGVEDANFKNLNLKNINKKCLYLTSKHSHVATKLKPPEKVIKFSSVIKSMEMKFKLISIYYYVIHVWFTLIINLVWICLLILSRLDRTRVFSASPSEIQTRERESGHSEPFRKEYSVACSVRRSSSFALHLPNGLEQIRAV